MDPDSLSEELVTKNNRPTIAHSLWAATIELA